MNLDDTYMVHKGTKYMREQADSIDFEDSCELCSVKQDSGLCRSLQCCDSDTLFTDNEIVWYWRMR